MEQQMTQSAEIKLGSGYEGDAYIETPGEKIIEVTAEMRSGGRAAAGSPDDGRSDYVQRSQGP